MRKICLFLSIFFFCVFGEMWRGELVFAGQCTGALQCYSKNIYGVCQLVFHYAACPVETSQPGCETAQDCECGVLSGSGSCTWSDVDPCDCSWGSYSSCYSNWAGCIKDRTCSCDPSGCGSCSGDNWAYCTAAEKGCTEEDCPTYAGYTGGTVRNGTLSSDCSCGTKTCPAICTATNPDTPTLYAPGTGTSVPVNQSVNLDWNGISSWGIGCPSNDNDYEVCVMSNDDSNCNYVNLTAQGDSNTNYDGWTPTAGDNLVYWKIRAHNGSNTATSSTWNFCVGA